MLLFYYLQYKAIIIKLHQENHSLSQINKMDSTSYQNINLLDIIPNAKQSEKNIHTFQDFRQWFNTIDLNQTKMEPINKSKLKRPQSFQVQQLNSTTKLKHKGTLGSGDSSSFGQQFLISGPILDMGLKKRKNSFTNNPFQFQEKSKQGSVRQGSARSSRSFNGYQQINQYQLRDKLGKGAFSQVFQGIDVESPQKKKYAIKIMQSKRLKKKFFRKNSHQIKQSNLNTIQLQPTQLQPLQPPQQLQFTQSKFALNQAPLQSSFREDSKSSQFVNNQIALLKKIDHQFITKLHEVIIDKQKGKAYLVLQYCENGFICENKNKTSKGGHTYRKLLESQCKRYFKQLALAINYIHTVVKIAHRDIKPENILISKNDQVKLSDFGLGTDQLQTDQYSGTKLFMPPQNTLTGGKKVTKTQTADIWAMGVTLLIMLTGVAPQYKENSIVDLNKKIDQLKDVSPELKSFLNCCLQKNPQKRITSQQILSHPWLRSDDPFTFLIQKSLVKQFELKVSKQQQNQAIKQAQTKKPKQKNYVLSLAV